MVYENILQLTPEQQYVWVAALVDCEGTMTINLFKCHRNYHLKPVVIIANTDKQLIDTVHKIFGFGFICTKKLKLGETQCYIYTISRLELVTHFIARILPYVTTKMPQMKILMSWIAHRTRMGQNYGSEYDIKDYKYLMLMSTLRRKGRPLNNIRAQEFLDYVTRKTEVSVVTE